MYLACPASLVTTTLTSASIMSASTITWTRTPWRRRASKHGHHEGGETQYHGEHEFMNKANTKTLRLDVIILTFCQAPTNAVWQDQHFDQYNPPTIIFCPLLWKSRFFPIFENARYIFQFLKIRDIFFNFWEYAKLSQDLKIRYEFSDTNTRFF